MSTTWPSNESCRMRTSSGGLRSSDNWELSPVSEGPYELVRWRLDTLERALVRRGRDVALFLIYDPPELVDDRPALVRAYFAQRSIPERVLEQMLDAFMAVGAYVQLFKGERPFIQALADGRLHALGRSLMVAYNGIESGVT